MATINFSNGKTVQFSGTPTQDDITALVNAHPELAQKVPVTQGPGLLSQMAGAVNNTYNAYTQLPGIKEGSQVVGGAVGLLGGVVGGVVGGAADIYKQTVDNAGQAGTAFGQLLRGKQVTTPAPNFNFGELGSAIKNTAIDTAKFGYQTGEAAAPAAPLGLLGKIPNALLATSQGIQAYDQLKQALATGNEEAAIQAGLSLGLSAVAIKNVIKTPSTNWHSGLLLNEAIGTPLKKTVLNATGITDRAIQSRVNAWQDLLNLPKSKVNKNAQFGRDPAQVLNDEGITPSVSKTKNGNVITEQDAKLMTTEIDQRLDPLMEAQRPLIRESGQYASLDALGQRAKTSVRQFRAGGTDYNNAVSGIDREIAALKENYAPIATTNAQGETIVPLITMNDIATSFQKKAFQYDPTKSNVMKGTDFQIGMNARGMIYEIIPSDSPLQTLNQHIGDLINAKTAIQSRIGTTTKGGGLTSKGLARIAGAVAGSSGGPLGSFIGALTADQVAMMLSNPQSRINGIDTLIELSRSSKGQALIQQANQLLASQRAMQASRPQLGPGPSGGIIQAGPGSTVFSTRQTSFPNTTGPSNQFGGEQVHLPTANDATSLPKQRLPFAAPEPPTMKAFNTSLEETLNTVKAYVRSGDITVIKNGKVNPDVVHYVMTDAGGHLEDVHGIPNARNIVANALKGQTFTTMGQLQNTIRQIAKGILLP